MRVLVTRPENEARRWVDELRRRGIEAVALPLIDIVPPQRPEPLHAAWLQLQRYRAVMFVSGNAVRNFFAQRPPEADWPIRTRAWATGAGTRAALIEAGLQDSQVDVPPPDSAQFDSETLWHLVAAQVGSGDAVLIARGGDASGEAAGRDWLADQIAAAGGRVETVVCYVRAMPTLDANARSLAQDPESVWLLSSSQAIEHLRSLFPSLEWSATRAVATHPRIAQAARRAGFGVVCESRPSVEAVAAALESFG